MKLRTIDGNLSLGSVYKLFLVGWICAWLAFLTLVLVILVLVTLVTGEMGVNGEVIHGRLPALAAMLPMLLLLPIVVALQAFIFAAFLTAGVWLYRLRRPLLIDDAQPTGAQAERPS